MKKKIHIVSNSRLKYIDTYSNYDYLLVETSPLHEYNTNLDLLNKADLMLLVARASRSWQQADHAVLKELEPILKQAPIGCLNGVKLDFIEEVLGVIPKKRSHFRHLFRRFSKLELQST